MDANKNAVETTKPQDENTSDAPIRSYDGPDTYDISGAEPSIGVLPRFGPARPAVERPVEQKSALDAVLDAAPTVAQDAASAAPDAGPVAEAKAGDAAPAADAAVSAETSSKEKADDGSELTAASGTGEKVNEEPTSPSSKSPVLAVAEDPDAAAMSALRAAVDNVLAERHATSGKKASPITEAELQAINEQMVAGSVKSKADAGRAPAPAGPAEMMAQVSGGQRMQLQGSAALGEGVSSALGGTMALGGAAAKVVGGAASLVASGINSAINGVTNGISRLAEREMDRTNVTNLAAQAVSQDRMTAVLPRLSDYRVGATERAATDFAAKKEEFWNSSAPLVKVREEMNRIARERGIPVQDIAQRMRPDGDLAELHTKFMDAVKSNPATAALKRVMDKAADKYVTQYGRAQMEALSLEQRNSPDFKKLTDKLDKNHERMEESVGEVPPITNELGVLEPSHLEKLREAISAIFEKFKNIAIDVLNAVKGKSGEDNDLAA